MNPQHRSKEVNMSFGSLESAQMSSNCNETLGTPRVPLKPHYGSKNSLLKVSKSGLRVHAKPSNMQTTKDHDKRLSKTGSYAHATWTCKVRGIKYDE